MLRLVKTAFVFGACAGFLSAQAPSSAVLLKVDWENNVAYQRDATDPSKLALIPNITQSAGVVAFLQGTYIADIVAVNGRSARGAFVCRFEFLRANEPPGPGRAIADIVRNGIGDCFFEIQRADGTTFGSISVYGLNAGGPPVRPPGTGVAGGNYAVTGGTGLFEGAKGNMQMRFPQAARAASITEDPANRRVHGGASGQSIFQLVGLQEPVIVSNAGGPAVFHNDFSPVTEARPARAGESLIAIVRGLGFTLPLADPMDPTKPFSAGEPRHVVASPVEVTVAGAAAEVVNAIGWPETVGAYRLDFRVPEGTRPGPAAVQITVGFGITGPEVRIPVR